MTTKTKRQFITVTTVHEGSHALDKSPINIFTPTILPLDTIAKVTPVWPDSWMTVRGNIQSVIEIKGKDVKPLTVRETPAQIEAMIEAPLATERFALVRLKIRKGHEALGPTTLDLIAVTDDSAICRTPAGIHTMPTSKLGSLLEHYEEI
jgi:hypothetical protein